MPSSGSLLSIIATDHLFFGFSLAINLFSAEIGDGSGAEILPQKGFPNPPPWRHTGARALLIPFLDI